MRKFFVINLLALVAVCAFSFEISILGGMEFGGKNRPYVGVRIGTLSSGISLMLEEYYPLSNIEEVENINIEDIQFLEADPYLYVGIPIFGTLIYTGAAPIVIYDIKNTLFSIYQDIFHVKAGMRFGKGIVLFVEGMGTMTTAFQFLDTFAISAGVGIGF